MSRIARFITPEGYLQCTKCKGWKFIADFYCSAKGMYFNVPDANGVDTWYGKPTSWCKECMKKSSSEHQKRRRAEQRAARLADPWEGLSEEERQFKIAYEEALRMGFRLVKDSSTSSGYRGIPLGSEG